MQVLHKFCVYFCLKVSLTACLYIHLKKPQQNVQKVFCVLCGLLMVFQSGSSNLLSPPGIANEQKKLYGTQFHPEVDLTERGMEMLRTFLFEIAGCTSNFTVQNRQQACINEIREKVDKSKVLVSKIVLLKYKFNECMY